MPQCFITSGPNRGRCNHRHTSRADAEACADLDQRECHRQGLVSDREPLQVHVSSFAVFGHEETP